MVPPASTHITKATKHLKSKGGVTHVKMVLLLLGVDMEEDIVEGVEDMAEMVVEEEEMVEVGVAGFGRIWNMI
ncbi:hypothetical protein N7527_011371 [Penicillium freii]|nr:hypothetical protein N7527_011371 [Penicillium freii]